MKNWQYILYFHVFMSNHFIVRLTRKKIMIVCDSMVVTPSWELYESFKNSPNFPNVMKNS